MPERADGLSSVFVVVLNWNRWEATRGCVESLTALSYGRKKILLVDNGSDEHPTCADALGLGADEFFQTGANLGYAGGNNVGLRSAVAEAADFAWVVNNDTIADADALTHLVAAATDNPSVGVFTTNVRGADGVLATDVAFRGSSRDAPWDYFGEPHPVDCEGCHAGFHAADCVRGPSLFFRVAALENVGLFDEGYFHYYEEVDLVERLRRAGWASGLACRAAVSHARGATLAPETGQSIYYLFRNYLRFRKQLYGESLLKGLARHPLAVPRYLVAARHTLKGDLLPLRAHLLAFVDAARGREGRRALGTEFQRPISFDR
ncbi:MAG: glycosyltransferase family 2 protein [Gaiellaceae bacterium]